MSKRVAVGEAEADTVTASQSQQPAAFRGTRAIGKWLDRDPALGPFGPKSLLRGPDGGERKGHEEFYKSSPPSIDRTGQPGRGEWR